MSFKADSLILDFHMERWNGITIQLLFETYKLFIQQNINGVNNLRDRRQTRIEVDH